MGVVMPLIAVVHLLVGIGFAVHAMKTGRPQFWMYILILVPVVGSLAYVLLELVPSWRIHGAPGKLPAALGTF